MEYEGSLYLFENSGVPLCLPIWIQQITCFFICASLNVVHVRPSIIMLNTIKDSHTIHEGMCGFFSCCSATCFLIRCYSLQIFSHNWKKFYCFVCISMSLHILRKGGMTFCESHFMLAITMCFQLAFWSSYYSLCFHWIKY